MLLPPNIHNCMSSTLTVTETTNDSVYNYNFTYQYFHSSGAGMCVTVWNLRHPFSSFISDKDETVNVRSNTPHYGTKRMLLCSISLLALLSTSEVIPQHHSQLKLPMLTEAQHCEISYYLWDLCLLPWLSSILVLVLCSTYHSHSNHLVRSAVLHLCVIQSESNKVICNKNLYLHL